MQDLRDSAGESAQPSPISSDRGEARAEEATLVARCQEGDMDAFQTIYRRHSAGVYNLVFRMVGNLTEAEDFVQEVFLQVYNKLSSYQGRAALGTWLHRLAINRCLDHLRSGASQKQSLTKSFEENRHLVPAPRRTWHRLDLEKAIVQLPHSHRAAFVLHDVEGWGHREVAEMLGVAEGTSKSLVHKARLKLRELLGPTPVGEKS